MAIVPQKIIRNQAYLEFDGHEIKSNTVVAYNKVYPTIKKSQDKEYVSGNDVITYTVRIKNNAAYTAAIKFGDEIPSGAEYIKDSFKINGVVSEVHVDETEITKDLTIPAETQIIITFQVRVETVSPEPEPEPEKPPQS